MKFNKFDDWYLETGEIEKNINGFCAKHSRKILAVTIPILALIWASIALHAD